MIQKLKKRIFWTIEISMVLVFLACILFLNIANYKLNENMDYRILENLLVNMESFGEGTIDEGNLTKDSIDKDFIQLFSSFLPYKESGDIYSQCSFYIIELDENNEVTNIINNDTNEYTDEELIEISDEIIKEVDTIGKINELKYLVEKAESSTYIVLMDSCNLNENIVHMLYFSVFAIFFAAIIFACMAFILTKILIKPIISSFENQKQFISDASHELKTPISVINANIDVLESEIGKNKWLKFIKNEGTRMAELVNGLLELSRIDYEKDMIRETYKKKDKIDISSVVMGTVLPFESVAYENKINFKYKVEENLEISLDKEEIQRITSILLDNAMKHTPKAGIVKLSLNKSLGRKFKFKLEVMNTGSTIFEKDIPLIFERFYKLDKSRKYNDNGYGLGLSIAKSIVEKNNGKISVSSKDEITIFSVLI